MANGSGVNRIEETRRKADQLRFARRSLQYFVRAIVLVVVILGVCTLAFVLTARVSNAYILVNEGMAMRAECILTGDNVSELQNYFTGACMTNDARLSDTSYHNYTINTYDYRLSTDKLSVMPWNTPAYLIVTEQVQSIKGTANTEDGAVASDIPAWTTVRYRVELAWIGSRCYITAVTVDEVDPDLAPAHTSDPNATPLPMATPTPEATELPTELPAG